ncbi:MAG: stage 0 sporulation protein [Clostridia bacterium]|nr:stage 0 sporulation protein [Clostridia bacterium]
MGKVVGVRFHDAGKLYKFRCDNFSLKIGDAVMVETQLGPDLAHVAEEPYEIDDNKIDSDVIPIQRIADKNEIERYEVKKQKENEAYTICLGLIEKHKLDMNLIEAVFAFDGKKIMFYFTSDNRVDFRELVKDLAATFKVRIELRQIGSRDQAKLIGGIGICGRELCCCTFLNHFAPVTLRMARDQGLSLNPTKLNGACGRLMCCLQYEKDAYEDAHRRLPKVGAYIRTPRGTGTVSDVSYLEEIISVKFVKDDLTEMEKFEWASLEPLNPQLASEAEKNAHNCGECANSGKCPNKNDDSEEEFTE